MKKINRKTILSLMNVLALATVVQSANTACCWLFHQPEFPESALKYKK